MSIDLTTEPDYDSLLEKLIEKTRAGKLDWQETANEDTYLAAVKGLQTFEIGLDKDSDGLTMIMLNIRDKDGKIILKHGLDRLSKYNSPLFDLYRLVRRVAMRIDENIESSLELLNNL